MTECRITTKDNPYDPFEDFEHWFLFDVEKGYNSCNYLSRVAQTSEKFSDEENNEAISLAIDEIIKHDPLNIYEKVEKNIEDINDI